MTHTSGLYQFITSVSSMIFFIQLSLRRICMVSCARIWRSGKYGSLCLRRAGALFFLPGAVLRQLKFQMGCESQDCP